MKAMGLPSVVNEPIALRDEKISFGHAKALNQVTISAGLFSIANEIQDLKEDFSSLKSLVKELRGAVQAQAKRPRNMLIETTVITNGTTITRTERFAKRLKVLPDGTKVFEGEIPAGPQHLLIESIPKTTAETQNLFKGSISSYQFEQALLPDNSGQYPGVAIDGDTAVVATSPFVHFFNKIDGSWKHSYSITIGTSDRMEVALFGNVAVVGAHKEGNGRGAVYVFEKDTNEGTWVQNVHIVPNDIKAGASFGCSVAIDGDVIVIGAPNDCDGKIGSIYVYRRNDDTWLQEAKFVPVDSKLEQFGGCVAIKGNFIAVSDYYYGDEDRGAVFLYEYDPSRKIWQQEDAIIVNDECGIYFGHSLAWASNGGMIIGCLGGNDDIGAVYYYDRSGPEKRFALQQKIMASDGKAGDLFGSWGQIAIDGNAMVVRTCNHKMGRRIFFPNQIIMANGQRWLK